MHAYLIIGEKESSLNKAKELATILKAKILEFPLNKIADTRELKNVTNLTFNGPTAIISEGIDIATEEAVNAFLKNLEEPQENIFYVLTASNIKNVLPTIISRCEIVKLKEERFEKIDKVLGNFLGLPVEEKLAYVDKIKDRGEAREFIQKLIENAHFKLLNSDKNKLNTVSDLEILIKTLNNLKLNGNVSLQLSNMAINLN